MTTGAAVVLDAPPRTPPPNGLLNSAAVVPHGPDDLYGINGVQVRPEYCGDARVFDPCATTNPGYTGDVVNWESYSPFGIEAYDECSAFGFARADYEGRARRALAATETKAIEHEFWTGTGQPTNPHLQSGVTVTQPIGATATSLRAGLDALVQAVADLNLGSGMIHARPALVSAWANLNVLRWATGNKLYTLTGTIVVPEAGATGAAPDGTGAPSATSEWAYVTDPVQVHQWPVEVFVPQDAPAAMDRATNTITVRAQRMNVVIGNFCAIAGVHINPTVTS